MGDSTAMTIEFLRARLLSERSVSRAARERTEQLAARVMELEGQLSIVTIQRKKAEKAASEVLAILETQEISDFSELIDLSPDGSVPYNDSRRAYESATASRMERSEDDGLSATEPEVFPSRDNSLAWKSHIKSDGKQMVNQIMQRQRWQSFMTTLQSSSEHQLGKSCRKIKQTDEGSARDCEKDKPTPLDAQGNGWVSCSNFRDDQPVDVEASRGMTEGAVADISDSHHVDSDHNRTTEAHLCGNGSWKDEDMERVLEKQAMLINQFQAEENAQREWEKKYNEKTISTLANYEPGNLLPESNSQSKKELSEFALRAVHISSTEATVESLPGSNKNDRSEEASNMTSSDGSMPKDTPTASSGRCSDGQESDFEHRQVGVVAKETKNISEKITASAHEHDGMIRNAKQKEATPHVASNAYPSNSRSRPHGNRARTIEGASSQINLLVDDHRKLLKLGPKQSQTPSSNLGGVLEALQRARLSLTQELRKKHSPSQGTSALAAPTSCPIGSATLFRLPTDSIPQPQQSRARFYASGSSFPAYRPGEEREGSSRAGKDCSQFDSNRVTTSAYGDPSPTPTYTEGGGSRVVAGREYTDNYFGTGMGVRGSHRYYRASSDLSAGRTSFGREISNSYSYTRNVMPPGDKYAVYGSDQTRSDTQIL